MKKLTALAVRPYPEPLRGRVFRLLAELGVDAEAPPELGHGTTNAEALHRLAARRPDLLLIPFHVVRDTGGERTSGLELLLALRREQPLFSAVPVIMPVSIFAQVAFGAAWQAAARPERVFALLEGDLDLRDTRVALRQFLYGGTADPRPEERA